LGEGRLQDHSPDGWLSTPGAAQGLGVAVSKPHSPSDAIPCTEEILRLAGGAGGASVDAHPFWPHTLPFYFGRGEHTPAVLFRSRGVSTHEPFSFAYLKTIPRTQLGERPSVWRQTEQPDWVAGVPVHCGGGQLVFFLSRQNTSKLVGVLAASTARHKVTGENRSVRLDATEALLTIGQTSPSNASALRQALPFLVPIPLGLRKSAGCGDRLGLATPGHIRAIRNSDMAPILAQQSIRENARTGRTPQQVMDDALWGVFQEGWRSGFGADADHLKTTADVDVCAAAGYTFYTIDPGEYVDNAADTAPVEVLKQKVETLSWSDLESDWTALEDKLGRKPVDLGKFNLTISRGTPARGRKIWPCRCAYGKDVSPSGQDDGLASV
jgi:hypothetical protein